MVNIGFDIASNSTTICGRVFEEAYQELLELEW